MPEERIVTFRPRTILAVIGIVLAVAALLALVWATRQVLTWILVALFLALALNPAVEFFQRQGLRRRGAATAVTVLLALGAIVGFGWLFIPTLVDEGRGFADALPGYISDVSEGRGPLGRFAERYELEQRVREAIEREGGAERLLGLSGTAIAVTKGVLTFIVAVVTIAFMTFFMLMEGPRWVERFYGLLPERSRDTWRGIGRDIYRTVGGYVTGNLLISVIAGTATTIVLLIMGVPYAVALGVLVAILDLIPLAGATLAAIIVSTVAFIDWIPAGHRRADLLHRLPADREPPAPAARLQQDGAAVAARDPDRGADGGEAGRDSRRPRRDPGGRRHPGAAPGLAGGTTKAGRGRGRAGADLAVTRGSSRGGRRRPTSSSARCA